MNPIFSDVVRQVGGDRVQVREVVPPGTDPHLFELTTGDVKRLAGADVVVAGGLGFEPYLDRLRESVPAPTYVVLGDFVKPIYVDAAEAHAHGDHGHDHDHDHDHEHAHDHGHETSEKKGRRLADPHWWQSVPNMERAVKGLRDALIEVDPEGKAVYRERAEAYLARLNELEKSLKASIAVIPRKERVIVTSHSALGYLGRELDIEVLSASGLTTLDEPSSKEMKALIDRMRADGVRAVFAENATSPEVLEQVMAGTGARMGGTLFVDTTQKGKAETYEAMMRHNVGVIVQALKP